MTTDLDQPRFAWISRIAFGIVLVIVIVRALMLETVRETGFIAGVIPTGPGPTTSLVLDWLSVLPALLLIVRRLLDRSFTLRFTLPHLFLLLLGLWTVLSTAWAGDKFLALVSGMHVLAGVSIFWTTSQLVRRWDHLRVVAGVVIGLLLANVAQGIIYRHVDLPDLHTYFQQNKAQILADRGWQPGEYIAERFERKLLAGEMLNFNVSPNALGAIVVLGALVALGATAQRVEDRDDLGWAGVLGIAALSAGYLLAYTGSKASWGALLLGVALLAVWRGLRGWLAKHHTFVHAILCAAVLLGICVVIGVGLGLGGLPEDSLNFRWRYWVGSWPIVRENPLVGVGWSNFAAPYLVHRLPAATEEINDPHDFLVRWCVELGAIGLALGVAWLAVWSWRATRSARPGAGAAADLAAGLPVKSVLSVCALAFAVSVACSADLFGDGNYLFLEGMRRLLLIGLVALAIGVVAMRDPEHPGVDGRPAPWLAAALFVGVAMLFVQASIDIVFFQPGPFTLVVCIMGALLGLTSSVREPRRESVSMIALIMLSIAWIAIGVAVVAPIAGAEYFAAKGQRLQPNQPLKAAELYRKAQRFSVVSNGDYALRAARALMAGGAPADQVRAALDAAVEMDPTSSNAILMRARWLASAGAGGGDVEQALRDFARGVAMNPNDVDLRIEYADLLERFGHHAEAARQLFKAIDVNDQYDAAEPERLQLRSPGRREQIQSRALRLQTLDALQTPGA